MNDTTRPHAWTFFRAGGFDQVRLDSGEDFTALAQLDQKLWTALACPTKGLEFDTKTLAMIDSDGDGRIRVPEIVAAARWAAAQLKNPDDLVQGAAALPLAAINDESEEGKQLLASAKEILNNLGKPEAETISVADTADTAKIFAQTRFNGDGIVPADSADNETDSALIKDIIECLGAETDRSGKPGINQDKLDQFFEALKAHSEWREEGEAQGASVLPLGDDTAAAFTALNAVRARVDDYFARCRLAAFDPRAGAALSRKEEEYAARAGETLSASGEEFAEFPLAKVEAGKPLPLGEGCNPAWAAEVAALRGAVIEPLLGKGKAELSDAEWSTIKTKFAPYETWLGKKAGAAVEKLGIARVRELLSGKGKEALTALIDQDKALEPEMNAIVAVERLIRYYRDLHDLLDNFVNFSDFYGRDSKAIFQAGTLYIDGRACDLCVRVDDPAKHGALASLSNAYLLYLDCTRRGSADKMTIAAAVTDGDADQLRIGRNGVFYDRKGQDWDATIAKIVEHPISIRQAIWSPYKRIARMIGDQIEKMAAAKDKAMSDKAAAGVQGAAASTEAGKPAAPAPFDVAKFAGIFAAIGLALGALGTALAAVLTGFLSLVWWQMPLAIFGNMLIISGPSVVLAWLKLRRRNLGPILDANGWAVNSRVKINIPFGRSLTQMAQLPPGARRSLSDPYAEKHSNAWVWIFLVAFLLTTGGYYYYKTQAHGAGGPPAAEQAP